MPSYPNKRVKRWRHLLVRGFQCVVDSYDTEDLSQWSTTGKASRLYSAIRWATSSAGSSGCACCNSIRITSASGACRVSENQYCEELSHQQASTNLHSLPHKGNRSCSAFPPSLVIVRVLHPPLTRVGALQLGSHQTTGCVVFLRQQLGHVSLLLIIPSARATLPPFLRADRQAHRRLIRRHLFENVCCSL